MQQQQPHHQGRPLGTGEFWRGTLRWRPRAPAPHIPHGPDSVLQAVACHSRPVAGCPEEPPRLPAELVVQSERIVCDVVLLLQNLKCRRGKVGVRGRALGLLVEEELLGPRRGGAAGE